MLADRFIVEASERCVLHHHAVRVGRGIRAVAATSANCFPLSDLGSCVGVGFLAILISFGEISELGLRRGVVADGEAAGHLQAVHQSPLEVSSAGDLLEGHVRLSLACRVYGRTRRCRLLELDVALEVALIQLFGGIAGGIDLAYVSASLAGKDSVLVAQ